MLEGRCYDKKRKRTRQEDHWERRRREQGCWRVFVVVSNASSEKVKLGKDEMRDPSNREPQSRARAVQEKKRNIWRRSPQLKSPLKFRQFTEIQRSE